ncbi:fumarylacetoacetate hydrolase family protein [Sphingomonas sp.]|uniref:fumarylacetoacetate hydrolase family protein n=1 Tax=Sphingomonas sp. TaxID=28214 RepID=UPI0025FDD42F|nr:fumarylacetoacetate hydrolase family protein [Sphingomonas sp.]
MYNAPRNFALGSFSQGNGPVFLGVVRADVVTPVAEVDAAWSRETTLFQLLENWPLNFQRLKSSLANQTVSSLPIRLGELSIHAPLPEARQIFCTGANFRKHVIEMVVAVGAGAETEGMDADQRKVFGEAYVDRQAAESDPYVFMKTVTSIAGPNDDLILPRFSEKVDWEIELAAVIGLPAYRVAQADAAKFIAGYMIVNDLTARDKVRRTDPGAIGPDWIAAKGAPGFLPMGPFFVPAEFVVDPHNLAMRLFVNGEVRQDDRTSDMTFDIPRQIEHISTYARMLPGDILCTGSPAGNGIVTGQFLKDGDLMEAEIDGLGRQRVHCIAAAL